MNFLLDAQLPTILARRLTELGHASAHVSDWLTTDAPDYAIWNLAVERRHVIITKDADYLVLAQCGAATTPLIWLRLGNCSNAELIAFIELRLDMVQLALAAGEVIIELR